MNDTVVFGLDVGNPMSSACGMAIVCTARRAARPRRERCGTPMQASTLDFVLAATDITTEIIADGRHLSPELLRFVATALEDVVISRSRRE